MKKALMFAAVLMGLTLTLASRPAMAATALQQLGQEAGIDAAPLMSQMKALRTVAAAEAPLTIPRRAQDVFEDCSALEERPFAPWTLKQAALLVQTCLNHAYAADGSYLVQAVVAPFGNRACPDGANDMTCRAIIEVVGIKIVVTGKILTGDSVLNDLNATLKRRGGKLLGFPATLENQAQIQN